jgi:hypothetical protein
VNAISGKREQENTPAPAPTQVHQENKQKFNPQFNQQNFYFGSHDPLAELKLKLEEIVIGYMKRTHPATGYEYDEVALALQNRNAGCARKTRGKT